MVVPHMTPDEFRRRGKEIIDWIADYLERVEEYPVLAQVKPGEIRSMLPETPPPRARTSIGWLPTSTR